MLGYSHQDEVDNYARNETCHSINQVMRLDINGGQTQENVEWQHRINQFVLARMPAQQHDDGTYTYMRTRDAHSIGLASCWINREDGMFATEEGKKLMKDWNLPEGLMGVGALALGYASAHPHTVKPRKEDYYRIIK